MSDENSSDIDDDYYIIDEKGEVISEPEATGVELKDIEILEEEPDQPSRPAAVASDDTAEGLRAENQELKDQFLRARADFENFRRRIEKEKSDYLRAALSGIIRDVLPVLDNFERALETGGEASDEFRKGIEMIHRQLLSVLQRHGVKSIEDSSVQFDPTLHEAIMRDEQSTEPANTVTQVLQKGYFLNDRLVRPAMVKVAVGNENQ